MAWSQAELAHRAGVSKDTIVNVENEDYRPKLDTVTKIVRVYELAGLRFSDGGVIEASNILTLHDHDGFSAFLDDVYHTAIAFGSQANPLPIFLSNVVHKNWLKWMGPEKWGEHAKRMYENRSVMDVRILVKEGDWNFPAKGYSRYKWVSEEHFNDRSFYSYHDRLAFLNFQPNHAEITIMRKPEFAEGYRSLFLSTWDHVAVDPA